MYSQNDSFDTPADSNQTTVGNKTKVKWYRRWWGILILIFLALFLSLAAALIFYVKEVVTMLRTGQITSDQLFGKTSTTVAPVQELPNLATDDAPSLGSKDAKVVIIEFGDFQCTYCQQERAVIKQLLADYGNKILFIFRDFPLIVDHPDSGNAALAADCANDQGKYWEMSDLLFANPDKINAESLKTWAVQLGLDTFEFGTCVDTAKYQKKIETDLLEGYNAGVRATPTFFINGYKVEGAVPLAVFEQIIASELARQNNL